MRRIVLIFTFIYLVSFMTACSKDKLSSIIIKDTISSKDISENDEIDFEIKQLILSKSFQNLEPKVDVLKKNGSVKILASLGLIETYGVDITNIYKTDNEINIHVKNISNLKKNQLAIPQVMIELNKVRLRSIENIKFNIINENYKTIKVKTTANETINKVNSEFQIVTNTSPEINMIKSDDGLAWEVDYQNIFDKFNLETPIVNMSVMVDANSGEILKSSKNFISSFVDEGSILDYVPNKYILYKKTNKTSDNGSKWISLCVYDLDLNTKEVLYTTDSEIVSASFNPLLDTIGILESTGDNNILYILNRQDDRIYKAMLNNPKKPTIFRWIDDDNIYVVTKSDSQTDLYNYNTKSSKFDMLANFDFNITGMQIHNENIAFTTKDKKTGEYSIQLTNDKFKSIMDKDGYLPRFISEKYLAYLSFNEKDNNSELTIINRTNNKIYNTIKLNVSSYFKIDDDTIGVISINPKSNDFIFHKYYIESKDLETIINITSDKAYYDNLKDLLYIDFKIPFENSKSQIIYSLDLSKVDNNETLGD